MLNWMRAERVRAGTPRTNLQASAGKRQLVVEERATTSAKGTSTREPETVLAEKKMLRRYEEIINRLEKELVDEPVSDLLADLVVLVERARRRIAGRGAG